MRNILKQLVQKQSRVCIYTNTEQTNHFIYGQIIGFDEYYFATLAISPDGEDDGILIKLIDDIFRIDESQTYNEKMQKLIRQHSSNEETAISTTDNLLTWGLDYAKRHGLILAIELKHSGIDDVVGFVESFDEELCKTIEIDEYGYRDGINYICMNSITQICINSTDEKRVMRLVSNS